MRLRSNSFIKFFVVFVIFTFANLSVAQSQAITTLESNKPIERTIKGSETHSYKIKLKAGEYFHVEVDQRGIDVVLVLAGADGKVIIERDRPNGTQGAESLSYIAETSGDYRLDVKALAEKAEDGKYEIKSELLRTPTATDKKRIEAETLFQEGQRLSQTATKESVTAACEKYEAAALLWREIGDKYAEALTQRSLGYGRGNLGEGDKAIAAYERALSLFRELKDRQKEATTLNDIGVVYFDLGENQKALDYSNQALRLY